MYRELWHPMHTCGLDQSVQWEARWLWRSSPGNWKLEPLVCLVFFHVGTVPVLELIGTSQHFLKELCPFICLSPPRAQCRIYPSCRSPLRHLCMNWYIFEKSITENILFASEHLSKMGGKTVCLHSKLILQLMSGLFWRDLVAKPRVPV